MKNQRKSAAMSAPVKENMNHVIIAPIVVAVMLGVGYFLSNFIN